MNENREVPLSDGNAPSGNETSIPQQAQLTAIQGPLVGTCFSIPSAVAVIGSAPEVEVSLSGSGVRARHAGLKWTGETWEIYDLTGDQVHVNDIPTTHRILGGGEIFRIGEHELHFTVVSGQKGETLARASAARGTEAVLSIELERGKVLGANEKIEIEVGPGYTIGRTPDNDLAIRDPLASRRHCRIEVIDDEAVLTDLGSLNGTHLEGRAVQQATLRAGDLIVVGKTALRCLRSTRS